MKQRICPNCGNSSPDMAAGCPCGFIWNEGVEVPAPDIVRARGGQRSVVEQMDGGEDGGPGTAGRNDFSASDHPLFSSSAPRRRATAPASFGNHRTTTPRPQAAPVQQGRKTPSDPVSLATKEETMVVLDDATTNTPASMDKAPSGAPAGATRPNAAMLMACPACDSRISRRATRCPKCDTAPYQACQICAVPIMVNSERCGECGDPDPFNTAELSGPRA